MEYYLNTLGTFAPNPRGEKDMGGICPQSWETKRGEGYGGHLSPILGNQGGRGMGTFAPNPGNPRGEGDGDICPQSWEPKRGGGWGHLPTILGNQKKRGVGAFIPNPRKPRGEGDGDICYVQYTCTPN